MPSQIPIHLGDANVQANNVYGTRFMVKIKSNDLINVSQVNIVIPQNSWLGDLGVNLRKMVRRYQPNPYEVWVMIALTRTDHISQSGHGQIAIIEIEDDIIQAVLRIPNRIRTISHDESLIAIHPGEDYAFDCEPNEYKNGNGDNIPGLKIYPNPTQNGFNIQFKETLLSLIHI